MASDTNGNLYVAVEDFNLGWIYVYRSTNGGATWGYLWGVVGGPTGFKPSNPSIACAEDDYEKFWVYVAYEAKHPDNTKSIDVLRFDPENPTNSDIRTVESNLYMDEAIYPEICTDSPPYIGGFRVYVTYHRKGGIDPAYQVMYSRSDDLGLTWSTPQVLAQVGLSTHLRPHIAFGGPLGFPGDAFRLFVVYEGAEYVGGAMRDNVFVRVSRYFGNSWDPPVQLTTSPDAEYDARVAAAVADTSVVVVYTRDWQNSGDLDIQYAYSTNAGVNWSLNHSLAASTDAEKTADIDILFAHRFHCAFWKGYDIHYTWSDDSDPTGWASPIVVNEENWASSLYSRPTVCANESMPEEEEACVAWTDGREPGYNAYFDTAYLWIDVCEGDFDDDGDVDGSDLAIFAADFGRTDCSGDCEGDFDTDGDVDGSDLAVFAADFGRTDCP